MSNSNAADVLDSADPQDPDRTVNPSINFGYIPNDRGYDERFAEMRFTRGIAVGGRVDQLLDAAQIVRTHRDDSIVALPVGLYWFDGIVEPILLQVSVGAPPGGATQLEGPLRAFDLSEALMSAQAWAEELWNSGTPLPEPRFEVNDVVIKRAPRSDALIRGRRFASGQWTYTVSVNGQTQQVLESNLEPVPARDEPSAWILGPAASPERFTATLTRAKLRGRFANTLYSFRASRTTFRAYQFKPVLNLLRTGRARILIADEVGLGKTIEAGLVWTELEARRQADRVLIVCPSGLVGKWRDEMESRFGFELTVLDRAGREEFLKRHRENRLPTRQAYVASLEALRSWPGLDELDENAPAFDLVVVDEAHQMRNLSTRSFELGSRLQEWASSLVFLSATPINLGREDLLNLLELLTPGEFGSLQELQDRLEPNAVLHRVGRLVGDKTVPATELLTTLDSIHTSRLGAAVAKRAAFAALRQLVSRAPLEPSDIVEARQLLAQLDALSAVITRTRKAEIDERKTLRDPQKIEVEWTADESSFYQEFMRWCQSRAQLSGQPMYFSMQMPIRLASACLPAARDLVLQSLDDIADETADDEKPASWLAPHPQLLIAASRLVGAADTKIELLKPVLAQLAREKRQALLFTFSLPTLRYLKEQLSSTYRIAVLNGSVPVSRRREIIADFRAGAYDFVFANRVASEGLDFEFCSAVINYDLPWNPMEIEQRIGRIDRIGQSAEKVLVAHFHNEEAIDERILTRVLDRIEVFEQSIGALEPIIAAQQDALKEAFDFSLTREQQEQKINQMLTALAAQQAELEDFTDQASGLLVSQNVDVDGLEGELERTGSYFGQLELANLLTDWAVVDGGVGLRQTQVEHVVELLGNATMADRVSVAAPGGRPSRQAVELQRALRSELPIGLVLDQEVARETGGDLLTASHPLVLAAANVPDYKHARFARLAMPQSEGLPNGRYIVVIAEAAWGDRREIWAAGVDEHGREHDAEVADAFLAAVAAGSLRAGTAALEPSSAARLAERAQDVLIDRQVRQSERVAQDAIALRAARRAALIEQHERRIRIIEQKIRTAWERQRGARVLAMFEAQRAKQVESHEQLLRQIDAAVEESVSVSPIAVCELEVLNASR